MKVVMNQSVAVFGAAYSVGQVVDVPVWLAEAWIKSGHARSYEDGFALKPETVEIIENDTGEVVAEIPVEESDADESAEDEYSDLTVAELREAAKAEGRSTAGTKAELLDRLRGE